MVYPESRLPVVIQIAPGAAPAADPGTYPWVTVTDDWRLTGTALTIEEGRGDWGERVDAGTCTLTLDNREDGRYSEYNPFGQWYGLLGRDTPLRVRLRRGEDAFGRSVAGNWGTSPSGQTWANSGIPTTDYAVLPGVGRHSPSVVNSSRNTLLNVRLVDVDVSCRITVPVLAAGASITPGVVARWTSNQNTYIAEAVINTNATVGVRIRKIVATVFTQLSLVVVPGLVHTAGTTYGLRFVVDGDNLAARVWDDTDDEPTGWDTEVVDTSHAGPGQVGCRSTLTTGNTNPLPVVLDYSAFVVDVDLFGGYVPAWPPRWDKSGNDRTVTVTARGTLYRYQPSGGKPPAYGPFRRTTVGAGAVAYWPCEGVGGSEQQAGGGLSLAASVTASALPGHPPISIPAGVSLVEVQQPIHGITRLPDLSSGAQLVATLPAEATAAATAAGAWSVQWATEIPDLVGMTAPLVLDWHTPGGTYTRWRFGQVASPTGYQLAGYKEDGSGSLLLDVPGGVTTSYDVIRLTAQQVGPNILIEFYDGGDSGPPETTTVAGTLTGPTLLHANAMKATHATGPLIMGHLTVFATADPPMRISIHDDQFGEAQGAAQHSWVREAATERARRVGAEDGVRVYIPPVDGPGEIRMGAQIPNTSQALFQQIEDSDSGVMYERPFRLAYQPRTLRYNQAPALVLDGQSDLSEAPEPDPYGQGYRNRWTVTRSDGGEATAEAPEVAAGAIVYDQSAEVSVYDSTTLAEHAWWRLHLSTLRELRWPALVLDLAARPELIDAWLCCRVGSRILVENPPEDVAGQPVDVLLEGATTVLGHKDFTITATVSPASPWDVAVADGAQRVPADGSTLAADLGPLDFSLSLASTVRNGPWTTDPLDFPLLARVGGEVVEISAIAGASPQTVTVSERGVNGVQRDWPAGTPVQVVRPAVAPL